jgi:hypothetical protein
MAIPYQRFRRARGMLVINLCRLIALCAISVFGAGTAVADFVAVSSRADLGGNDFVDWGQLGPVNFSNALSVPRIATSNNGYAETLSKTSGFIYADQQGPVGPWQGNFAPNDKLLYNGPQFSSASAVPLDITFASLVQGAGTQIEFNQYGAFQATLAAFDASHNLLFQQTFNGNSTNESNGSAMFIGVVGSTASIAMIEISSSTQAYGINDFAINQLDIKEPLNTPVPSSLAMLAGAAAVGGIGAVVRRARRQKRNGTLINADPH